MLPLPLTFTFTHDSLMEQIYSALQKVELCQKRVKKSDQVRQRLGHAALPLCKLVQRCGSNVDEKTKLEAGEAADRFVQANQAYQQCVIACDRAVSQLSLLRMHLDLLNGDFGHDELDCESVE